MVGEQDIVISVTTSFEAMLCRTFRKGASGHLLIYGPCGGSVIMTGWTMFMHAMHFRAILVARTCTASRGHVVSAHAPCKQSSPDGKEGDHILAKRQVG